MEKLQRCYQGLEDIGSLGEHLQGSLRLEKSGCCSCNQTGSSISSFEAIALSLFPSVGKLCTSQTLEDLQYVSILPPFPCPLKGAGSLLDKLGGRLQDFIGAVLFL